VQEALLGRRVMPYVLLFFSPCLSSLGADFGVLGVGLVVGVGLGVGLPVGGGDDARTEGVVVAVAGGAAVGAEPGAPLIRAESERFPTATTPIVAINSATNPALKPMIRPRLLVDPLSHGAFLAG